jgi:hypothetical protein
VRPGSRTWRGHRRVGQDGAVREQRADAEAEAGVEHADHQPQVRVEVVGTQRGVDVADVVLADQGQRPRVQNAARPQRGVVQLGRLDQPHAGQQADPGAVVAVAAGQHHGHLGAEPVDQLAHQPVGQRVVPAHHEAAGAGIPAQGVVRHGPMVWVGPGTGPRNQS